MSRSEGERPPHRTGRGTLAGLVSILLWGWTVALARSLTEQLGMFRAAASVYAFGGACCLLVLAVKPYKARELRRQPRRYLFICGSLFVLYMVVLFVAIGLSVDREQVLEITLINYLWCPLTLLISIPVLGKRAGPLVVPGTVCALAGIFLVIKQDFSAPWSSLLSNAAANPLAYLLAFAAAVMWALYSNLTRRLAGAEGTSGAFLFLPVTGAVLLAVSLTNPEEGAWTVRAVIETALLGASTTIAYLLWDVAMRKGDVVLVAAGSYFVPLLATLVSCLYLTIVPGLPLLAGCLLLVAGSLLSWKSISDRIA